MTVKQSLPSDRSFGLTFAVVFAVLSAWLAYTGSDGWMATLPVSAVFATLALLAAKALHAFNVAWMWFGSVLHRIVSPIVLGIVFFGVLMPFAIFFRLRGRDVLNRKFESTRPSYWQARTPPGPDAERSFPRQF